MRKLLLISALAAAFSIGYSQNSAHDINEKLGRGINFGNMFESPRSGGWGALIEEYYFEEIADKGFQHIRIPIKWSDYALAEPPYTIEEEYIDTIKATVDLALKHKLLAIINMHHYDEIFDDPDAHLNRFVAIWDQISEEFKDYPDSLLFELLNEPHGNLTSEKWNAMYPIALDTVRDDNPTRKVIIGPPDWNGIGSVNKLAWPENDTNLIMTVHYYGPFHFTHQGASWVDNSDSWLGTTWDSTATQMQAVVNDFAQARNFFDTKDVPVYVGEFGSYSRADMDSRAKWTAYIARTIESFGFSWAYWEFKAGFGAWDDGNGFWLNPLLRGLTEQTDSRYYVPDPWELSNSDFSRGTRGWDLATNGGSAVEFDTLNGEGVIDIQTLGSNPWEIQLSQGGLILVEGAQYRFSFDARCEGETGTLMSYIGQGGNSYAGWNTFSLTDEMTTYSYSFTMTNPTDNNAKALFDLGYVATQIFLDNITLELVFMPVLVEKITLGPESGVIDTPDGSLQLTAEILPEDATNQGLAWEVVYGEERAAVSDEGLLTALGTSDGLVRVRASAMDISDVFDELVITLSNQAVGLNPKESRAFKAYVTPGGIHCTLPESKEPKNIQLYSLDGKILYSGSVEAGMVNAFIPMSHLEKNIYLLELRGVEERALLKIAYLAF